MTSPVALPIEIQASLDALKQRLLAELPAQQQYIESAFAEWRAQNPLPVAPFTLVRAVHSLSGRAGMYGMDTLFQLSQRLERALLAGDDMSTLSAFSIWRAYLNENIDVFH